jgi:antitoxin component YwqK of YwqJK toxin-antitoxin module
MRRFLFLLLILTTWTATVVLAQTTAPAALTTAGGPPVKSKKQKPLIDQLGLPISSSMLSGSALNSMTKPSALTSSAMQATGLDKSLSDTKKSIADTKELFTETLPDLGLKIKQLRRKYLTKSNKKRQSRTEYESLGMVEAYVKIGSGDRTIVEKFFVLKGQQIPSAYARELFWYDQKNNRVTSSVPPDRANTLWLHGPYKRFQNGDLVEEGFYYVGTKDGRWEKYDANFMLLDKSKWLRGFPAESRIVWYDSAHTKIKEVMPVEFGKVRGTYLAFHPNGQLVEEGKYDNGIKIGRWTEYYPQTTRRFRKKLTQYPRDQWETGTDPVVISEWDEKGKATYERPKDKASKEETSDSQ